MALSSRRARAAVVRGTGAALASALRAAPPFRGKGTLGLRLQRLLDAASPAFAAVRAVRLRNGTRMLVDLRSPTERIVFWTGEYDAAKQRALVSLLPPDAVVVDVGANVGFWTVALAAALPGGRVYAVEPLPANAARLRENVALNGLSGRVVVTEAAVSDARGTLSLGLEPGAAETGNAAPVAAGDPDAVRARALPLDELADELGIARCALLKLDVEGSELSALRGAAAFLSSRRPLVFLELNRHWMERFGWGAADLLAFARETGYEARLWDGGGFRPLADDFGPLADCLLQPEGAGPSPS